MSPSDSVSNTGRSVIDRGLHLGARTTANGTCHVDKDQKPTDRGEDVPDGSESKLENTARLSVPESSFAPGDVSDGSESTLKKTARLSVPESSSGPSGIASGTVVGQSKEKKEGVLRAAAKNMTPIIESSSDEYSSLRNKHISRENVSRLIVESRKTRSRPTIVSTPDLKCEKTSFLSLIHI